MWQVCFLDHGESTPSCRLPGGIARETLVPHMAYYLYGAVLGNIYLDAHLLT
ncbi:hypothetical protein E5S67_04993 [Microcoleus sp. IPMA8]|uniref:Uncharacterized protein n=1 Tax=Microcoleus asticus IPMA8 TaxID=2563858 RepID=A0ABX2D3L3_9CYAN|nr:hypothetical protein [Microcoleus asticus IPMA8]